MSTTMTTTSPRGLTVLGLAGGALGIAGLWAAGAEFPFYPPPGLVILGAGAVLVATVQRPWTAATGAFLGLFVWCGFTLSSVVSGAGTGNLTGEYGIAGSIATVVQLIGVTIALVAGIIAFKQEQASA